jgi:hypothetical protein
MTTGGSFSPRSVGIGTPGILFHLIGGDMDAQPIRLKKRSSN